MLAEHQHLNKTQHRVISFSYFEAFHYSKRRSFQLDQVMICIVESQLDIDQILSLNKARKRKCSRNCSNDTELFSGYWLAVKALVQHFGCILYLTEKGYKPSAGNSSNLMPRDEHIVWHWRKENTAGLLDNGQLTFSTAVRTGWENVLNLS